jgi:hypothetical protein
MHGHIRIKKGDPSTILKEVAKVVENRTGDIGA